MVNYTMEKYTLLVIVVIFLVISSCTQKRSETTIEKGILKWDRFSHYIETFNNSDDELYQQFIPNDRSGAFLKNNIPYFECPDKELEKNYYFRWWTYRKHIRHTQGGFVITEFLPDVSWSGKYNTISCPAGHHFYEGRWLHNPIFLKDYALFWFKGEGNPQQYSFWSADAVYRYLLVHPDRAFRDEILPLLKHNLDEWKKERRDTGEKLFWQYDGSDGMEITVSGAIMNGKQVFSAPSLRPTINSYMYGDLKALARLERESGLYDLAATHEKEAEVLRAEVQERLWSPELNFFHCLPRNEDADTAMVRELIGYVPWYFNLPEDGKGFDKAWKQIKDTTGFKAPFGPTTVEQRHSAFDISYEGHECQWNGPTWPFATTQTLKAMANLLRNYDQDVVSKTDYWDLLKTYTHSHTRKNDFGQTVPWIDENLNPYTGDWISRTRLKTWDKGNWSEQKGGVERGKDYNHSGFCDLIISDLIGVRPEEGNSISIHPLLSNETWSWFCLDHLKIKNRIVTIVWDSSGNKYGVGKGFLVYVDGKLKVHQVDLKSVIIDF